jgi:hypothetical protein
MPTIEIVSVNANGLNIQQVNYDVAIIEESKYTINDLWKSHDGLIFNTMYEIYGY